MIVKLLNYTSNPEKICAIAALTSYKNEGPIKLYEKIDKENARKILKRIINYGHISVIEHANFTFSIEGVSRSLTHQLVRHRIASYTQQSQRYVIFKTMDNFIIPKTIADKEITKKIYEDSINLVSTNYKKLIDNGIPQEDARFLLPNAAKTNILVTMNARELRHFFNLRCCMRSQWEIRELAIEMLKQVKKVAPILFEKAGPSCVELGFCPEKELKKPECKIEEIVKKYEKF